jgi:hypothetical protein
VGVGAARCPARRVRIERRGFATRKRRASGFLSSLWFFFSVALFFDLPNSKNSKEGTHSANRHERKIWIGSSLGPHLAFSLFFAFVCFTFLSREDSSRWQESRCLVFFLFLSFFYFPLFFWTLLFVRTCQILLGSRFMLLRGLATEGGCHGARGGQCVVGKNGEKRRRARV